MKPQLGINPYCSGTPNTKNPYFGYPILVWLSHVDCNAGVCLSVSIVLPPIILYWEIHTRVRPGSRRPLRLFRASHANTRRTGHFSRECLLLPKWQSTAREVHSFLREKPRIVKLLTATCTVLHPSTMNFCCRLVVLPSSLGHLCLDLEQIETGFIFFAWV